MLKNIRIEGEKGIIRLNSLNRVNIFIGHDGCGKSAILDEISAILPDSQFLDGFCPINQLQQRTHEVLLDVSQKLQSEYENYEKQFTTKETVYDYDPITGIPLTPEGRQVVKKPGFEGPFGEWNEEGAYNLTIARCLDVIQSVGAISYGKTSDSQNYSLFMRNGDSIPWNKLSRGQMQTIQMLYEINLGKSKEIIMNRAESACFPAVLGQIAHNILVSDKQYFFVTDTVLLNGFFDMYMHKILSNFLNKDLFSEINLYIVYTSLADMGIGIETKTRTICLTGEELKEFAKQDDLYSELSRYYKH